jgi:hypothetical protein
LIPNNQKLYGNSSLGSRVEFANFPPGFNAKGTSGGESIFLGQILDESVPLEELLQIEDMPRMKKIK